MTKNCYIEEIRQSSRIMVRELGFLRKQVKCCGIPVSHSHAMIELEHHGSLTIGKLAKHLNLDISTTSRLVKNLIAQKLVTFHTHVDDKRSKLLMITDKGKKTITKVHEFANEHVDQALSLLHETDQIKVVEGMKLYSSVLKKARMQQGIQIKPIQKKHNQQLRNVFRSVMQQLGAVGEGTSSNDLELDSMHAAYKNDRSIYFVVLKDDQVLGGGGIAPLKGGSTNICELKKVCLLPEFRGIGLGDKLLKICLESAAKMKYQKCYLESSEIMHQARNLYKKFGFVERSAPLGHTGHHSCNCWFEKILI